MLEIWVGLTNANRREISVIERVQALFQFSYLNADGNGNPVFKNVGMIHFYFPVGWASPPGNWVSGALFSSEKDGYSFFDSSLKISGMMPEASGINFEPDELGFEVIGISEAEREVYVGLEKSKLQGADTKPDVAGMIHQLMKKAAVTHAEESKKILFGLNYNEGPSEWNSGIQGVAPAPDIGEAVAYSQQVAAEAASTDLLVKSAVAAIDLKSVKPGIHPFDVFLKSVRTETMALMVNLYGQFGKGSPKNKSIMMKFAQGLATKMGTAFKADGHTMAQTRARVFKRITNAAAEFGLDIPFSFYVGESGLKVVLASTPGMSSKELLAKAVADPPPPVIVTNVLVEDTKLVCDKCFTNFCDCADPAFIPLHMAKQKKKEQKAKKKANAKAAAKYSIMVDNGQKIIEEINLEFAEATQTKGLTAFAEIQKAVPTVYEVAADLGITIDTDLLKWLEDNLKFT